MDEHRIDPADQVPEADRLEQQIPIDPQELTPTGPDPAAAGAGQDHADEGDRWEQLLPAGGGDDDDHYPHDGGESDNSDNSDNPYHSYDVEAVSDD